MSGELREALGEVARRVRSVRLWAALAACWLAWMLLGVGLATLAGLGVAMPTGWRLALPFVSLAAASGLLVAAAVYRSVRDPRRIARRIERRFPELATGLIVAVEDGSDPKAIRSGFLHQEVVRGVLAHRGSHDWEASVPSWSIWASELCHAATLGGLIVVALFLALRGGPPGPEGSASAADAGRIASGLVVEPGDTEIERGTSLLVVARFNDAVPGEAELVLEGEGLPSADSRRAMARSLEDPTFAARVDRVETDLSYRIAFAGRSSETYRVRVFDFPQVLRIDADLDFPDYTGLDPKTVEDIRHVTAIEGTGLGLRVRLNKEVASARLVDGEEIIDLTPVGDGSGTYSASLTLADPRRYRIELVDTEGRSNKEPTELAVNVTRNRPPDLRIARPARDVRVSPIEELELAASIEDDFGIVRHGVTVMLAGEEPTELVLGEPGTGVKQAEAGHLIAFESLDVEPDELASYHFWAEDVGPDGSPRRTFGDLFFAEIRPFEEIFRQGEPPSGGPQHQGQGPQGGAGQQAMELAELQKQIINATWSLLRRESPRSAPSEAFGTDVEVVLSSQRSAVEQAGALSGELQDPESIAALEQAIGFMNEAVDRLSEAKEGADAGPLDAAISSEQAAYQALLRLRDREFQVVRGQPGQAGGGGGAGGPSQRQLQQLELSNDENRYEQRSSAEQAIAEQSQADRELRQVLNRLRELARRQEDLNDRVQELQSALEAAESEEEREEIERQLKRLREQQQQLLRDADELRERMEREENRDRLADARQQVEQSREHLRRASEALEEGRLSQAITEGTRAGRQLDELGEQLRRRTSERFAEDLQQMREQARQLAEEQRQLTERLAEGEAGARRSLRDGAEDDAPERRLEGQRDRLDQLLDRMRQTVQDAEEDEPLLAEELFEAVRRADDQAIGEAIDAAQQLAGLGINEEAARASEAAAEGLDQLREGVERAADRVLGDDTTALRLARNELDDLAEQVGREIDRALGRERGEQSGAAEPSPSGQPGEGASPEGDRPGAGRAPGLDRQGEPGRRAERGQPGGRPGEPSEGEQADPGPRSAQRSQDQDQPGEGRPGEGQPGAGQPGENQPGEGQQAGEQQGQGQQGSRGQGQEGQQGGPGGQRGGQGGLRGEPTGDRPAEGGGGGSGGLDDLLDGFRIGGRSGPGGPIVGDGFREWSDRMRDVEELLDDPELSAEAARIRDRVRGAREEFRRHAREPDWEKLQDLVAEPIRELRDRVAEELRRLESPDDLVPIDRDPVPPRFAEGVRRYFERLGSGE
ncbi:DUF4175 family protein [Tautonia sociabilis]|uniref:DUF4175 family protein n=1 Tax=Tautonia sociabilis TaxID=2080755 RepID=A0A432MJ44_9BACT|nr:DUF4175 family protein [Tautonia sociabilis]RUL87176.1 hypothetical protein TsocGM_13955 [Tautonia sociabilis]